MITIHGVVKRHESSVRLMEYVRALENKDSRARAKQVLVALAALGIQPAIQECHRPRITNIVVDFSPAILPRSGHADCLPCSQCATADGEVVV